MKNYVHRESWENHISDQVAEPMRVYTPNNLRELRAIITKAEDNDTKVKPVGSGHSWSDVCKTSGFLIKPNKLNKVLSLEKDILKPNSNLKYWAKVESGMTIRELNDHLDSKGMALSNMGGFDGQTIIGATATSTHGSGIKHGPLSDMIIALEIVGSKGVVYRIESSEGISDPSKYNSKHPDRILIQDDQYLEATKVSLGCIGAVYSVILTVRDAYYLKETRVLKKWSEVKNDLINNNILDKHEHYEVLIHPYLHDEDFKCLVTNREETTKPNHEPADKLRRNVLTELFSKLPLTARILKYVLNKFPTWTEELLEKSIEALADDAYINKSYKVYNIGEANHIPSFSSEIALPMKNNLYLDGIEHLLKTISTNRYLGHLYQTAPIALRFVKGCQSMMSPQYQRDTCMIEIIMIKDSHGGKELYEILETEMYKYGGRPHWGQFNYVTQSKINKYNLYPALNKWIEVKHRINDSGVFDNYFAARIGVEK